MSTETLKNLPLLVFANKQDAAVYSVVEIADKMNLSQMRDREWHIQGACALTGEGLFEGFDWLSKALKNKK